MEGRDKKKGKKKKEEMSKSSRELVFLILQFLDEEKIFKETVHKLEKESGLFFNMQYFEDCVTNGEWDEVEKYLSGYTKFDDNLSSKKIFFEIRKQKYLEALDKRDNNRAVEILVKDLKVFSTSDKELFKEIALLLTLANFRENEQLSNYGDTKSARAIMLVELKKLIQANPLFRDKLQFPTIKKPRLRTLIDQGLNLRHQHCKNPPNDAHAPSPSFQPAAAPAPAPVTASLAGGMANPSSVAHQTLSAGPIGLPASSNADFENVLKRPRPFGISEEMNNLPVTYPGQSPAHSSYSSEDLPKNVFSNLNQSSTVKSMDFHPVQQTLLLVGTNIGDITIWEAGTRERVVSRNFKVWDLGACSMILQASLAIRCTAAVNRVIWSSDGALLGVAYSKHIVHIYSYHGSDDLRNHLEIDAHVGNVSDLAFSEPNKQLCIITCGEDKTIKVWDAVTGNKQYTFEGHEAPVFSVCPHHKSIQFIFSTAIDGKIKAWLYDNMGSRVDYDAPGRSCTTMAYSADGNRLFSCGTNKEGESHIVEWNENEGAVKQTYHGLEKRSVGVVQFDTTRNRFLAVGDEFQIKFWDMDNVNLLTATNADGELPASPCLRFNKEGSLLAVSTNDNGIKILANAVGTRLLHSIENRALYLDLERALDVSRAASVAVAKGPITSTFGASSSTTGTSIGIAYRSPPMTAIVGLNEDTCTLPNIEPRVADIMGSKGPITSTFGASSSATGTSIGIAYRSPPMTAIVGLNEDTRTLPNVKPRVADIMGSKNGDTRTLPHAKPRVADKLEKSKSWKLTEMNEPSQLRSLRLPDSLMPIKVVRMIYTHTGDAILALTDNAVHKLWKWPKNEHNLTGKATSALPPQLCQHSRGILMTNDICETNREDAVPCFALSENNSYVISASGGKLSIFIMTTFKTTTTFMAPPPAATSIAFHPQDNNVIAIGMDDSSIQIYNVQDQAKTELRGHQKRVTGLAFSNVLSVLVSSGADAQLCLWSMDGWEKQASEFLRIPGRYVSFPPGQTRVQFHQDQIHVLAVHGTHIAIYEAPKLECLKQWIPRASSGSITDAVFSCDSQSIYVSNGDASVCILTSATFQLRCRINPGAYLPSNRSGRVYPVVVAAHPSEPNQFALGLSDGGVLVLEPPEEGNWGSLLTLENDAAPTISSTAGSDQQPR